MTEMTVLNGVAIEELLTIPMAVEAVEQAYLEKSKGDAALWPLVFHEFDPGRADLDIKSGDLGGLGFYGLKVVSWFGANPGKGLPALYGTSLLFDLATGAPRALLNAGPITDFRTGAAGAIGAKYLARPDAETLLMAGTGALAPYLIAATLYLLPQIKTVYVTNPPPSGVLGSRLRSHHTAGGEATVWLRRLPRRYRRRARSGEGRPAQRRDPHRHPCPRAVYQGGMGAAGHPHQLRGRRYVRQAGGGQRPVCLRQGIRRRYGAVPVGG